MRSFPVRRVRRLAPLLVALALCACFGKKPDPITTPAPPPPPKTTEWQLVSAADLNPDAGGRPSPLVVRVYSLRALDSFRAADFFSLYEKDEQVLAADLVRREEWILKPGETREVKGELPPEVKFVAVVAAFRDVSRATWRASVPVPPGPKGMLTLRADGKSVGLAFESVVKD